MIIEDNITKKLNYIGLNLDNIPSFISEFSPLSYRPRKHQNDLNYKVYRYIDINDITILLTPTNRLTNISERYEKGRPLLEFLNEENVEEFATFLSLLKNISIEDIENLEEQQKKLKKDIPLKIKFEKDYLWQIFYSEADNKYFMLAPITETEYAEIFYILKKQIEGKNEKIFVPICYADYSDELTKSINIQNLENYIWLFTKNWPAIYEVYDKKDNKKIVITGKTQILEGIESDYKLEFKDIEEIIKFSNLLKSLFLLKTSFPNYYKFLVKVTETGQISLYDNDTLLDNNTLLKYIKSQYLSHQENILLLEKEKNKELKAFTELKEKAFQLQTEFLEKEKQITTFLECKKTFLGRVKYFFRHKKNKNTGKRENTVQNSEQEEVNDIQDNEEKEIYTIQDLIYITRTLEQKNNEIKNIKMDIEAKKIRIDVLKRKVKNANLYIEEIENHKKNIFDFLKFTSKDEVNRLSEPINSGDSKKLKKVFNLNLDLQDLKSELDKQARKLTKQEQDLIFTVTTDILKDLNLLMENSEIPEKHLSDLVEELRKYKEDLVFDFNKLKANAKYEGKKNRISILNIKETTTMEEYKEILEKIKGNIESAMEKFSVSVDVPIYYTTKNKIKAGFNIFNINPEETMKNFKQGELNIYRIILNDEIKFIPLTNIIFYDNINDKLPLGMDEGTNILINIPKEDFKFTKTIKNNIVKFEDDDISVIKINILELAK